MSPRSAVNVARPISRGTRIALTCRRIWFLSLVLTRFHCRHPQSAAWTVLCSLRTRQYHGQGLNESQSTSTLLQIARTFIRYANATFGGGSATTVVLHRALVEERSWVEPKRFALIYALARLTPGANLLELCTGLGWQLKGWRGAIIALLAASIPCSVIVILVSYFFDQVSHNRIAQLSIRGALAAAVGITVVTCWTISKPHFRSPQWLRAALFSVPAFALAVAFGISPIRILLAAAAVGCLVPARSS